MASRLQHGMTLIEVAIVLVIASLLVVVAFPGFVSWNENMRVKGAARAVADAFSLARAEAIRTGNNHLVVLQSSLGATQPIEVVNDADADCTIDAGETVHQVAAVPDVSWGTTPGLAGGTVAPDDPGLASANIVNGSSFTDATMLAINPASWVLFQRDAIPRVFTPNGASCAAIGQTGRGGGGIYLSNGKRDYAIVLSHLGAARVHLWNEGAGAWTQ